jgi:RNA-directed DNA polymerase
MAGDVVTVHQLQRRLLRSYYAKLLAVRKISQENQGKRTAGVDGIKVLTPPQRFELAQKLDINRKARPIRRVYIPKPGKTEKRPLGIPTMHDRACQCLVKLALEPEWEAKFHPESYGFRPGRSAMMRLPQSVSALMTREGKQRTRNGRIIGFLSQILKNVSTRLTMTIF